MAATLDDVMVELKKITSLLLTLYPSYAVKINGELQKFDAAEARKGIE